MVNNETIAADAAKALRYDAKLRHTGGFTLTHSPSCYGIAIKWLMGIRKITFAEMAKRLNGTTAQNLNHLINRADKSRFFADDVERICKILKVSTEYFDAISEKIEKMMEN